jgi:acyl carrier protein
MENIGQIREFIVSNFLFGDASSLQDDQSFFDSGIVDSTGILELVTFLETTFKLKIEPQEMVPANLDCVNKVAQFVSAKLDSVPAN